MFLANYADGLTDVDLDGYDRARSARADEVAALPQRGRADYTFHVVEIGEDEGVAGDAARESTRTCWINGGYFVFRQEIFDDMRPGEELVEEPFQRLIERKRAARLIRHDGFWARMDTFKDKQPLEDLVREAGRPWQVWKTGARAGDDRARASRCRPRGRSRVLCLGAHSDDIEIGCGGTLLRLREARPEVEIRWVVLTADAGARRPRRAGAPRSSASIPRSPRHPDRRLPRRLPALRGRAGQGLVLDGRKATGPPTSSSPTPATTCTRTTASSPS